MLKCWINPVTVHFRCWNGNYRIYPPGLFASCLPFAIYRRFSFLPTVRNDSRNLEIGHPVPANSEILKDSKLKIEKWCGRKWNFKTLTLWKYPETSLIWTTCQPFPTILMQGKILMVSIRYITKYLEKACTAQWRQSPISIAMAFSAFCCFLPFSSVLFFAFLFHFFAFTPQVYCPY